MEEKPPLLVIDDEIKIIRFLKLFLSDNEYKVDTANTGSEGIQKVKENIYDLVIVDLKMEDYSGLDVLKVAKEQYYNPEVILMTGHGSIASAVEAIKQGAFDYVTKPFDSKRMIITIGRAIERKRLKEEVEILRKKVKESLGFNNIVGQGPAMRKLMETVELVARIDSTVLIHGESGTGKELIARSIHAKSERRDKQFIPVNCGALPEHLLESELFGYVKGAFTGATNDRKGLFEEADEGTILLDEIGDMPLPLQVKLLRVLENGEVRRLGNNRAIMLNLRVIASTNRELESLVKEGKFREDLFYRLNVIPLIVPPLRERKEDIGSLLVHYLKIFKNKFKRDIKGFEPDAIEFLINYDWSGNVRELSNLVERTAALVSSQMITLADISRFLKLGKPIESVDHEKGDLDLEAACEKAEKECIVEALVKNDWNQTRAALDLGISRTSLWRKMKQFGITVTNQ